MWAKVPAAGATSMARARPAPYNASGLGIGGEAGPHDDAFAPTGLHQ
jgi:hypothetical protein